jgi:hypothetical protein
LTADQPARNTEARYNVCPTDPIDTVVERDGKNSSPCAGAWCHGGGTRLRTLADVQALMGIYRKTTVNERHGVTRPRC